MVVIKDLIWKASEKSNIFILNMSIENKTFFSHETIFNSYRQYIYSLLKQGNFWSV